MTSARRFASSAALIILALVGVAEAPPPAPRPAAAADIDRILEATGAWNATEEVYKVALPRSDVPVHVDGFALPPILGLTSWVAFKGAGAGRSMMMGDLVLFQDEVNPAIDVLLARGAEVTALHNHFFYDDPHVLFMHVGGTGATLDLAGAVRAALDAVHKARQARPVPSATTGRPSPPKSALDAAALSAVLGVPGQSKDGMFKAVFGRRARHGDTEIGADMGINTWAAFAGGPDDAIVDGDFAVREGELQQVLRTLRKGGIDIVAIHQHMTLEEPRLIFLHYWGRGDARRLASTVRQALDGLAP